MAKLITLAVVALAGFATAEVDELKSMETFNKCRSEINADRSDIEAILRNYRSRTIDLPTSDKGKCIIACLMEASGLLKDGKYSLDGILASAEEMFGDNADKLIVAKDAARKCQSEVEAVNAPNKCDLSVEIAKCLRKYADSLEGSF